ncbi:hypothetical protein ALC57_09874, partial [Trachymyrmex cornetzi]
TGCDSDLSECEMDVVEKFISVAEIRTLNPRTKVCISHDYFTTGGALALCTECMFNIADIVDVGMYIYRKHETGSFGRLSGRWSCHECGEKMYIVYPCNVCPFCTHEKTIEKSSNDTECLVRLDDGNIDRVVKFVQPSEIEALNIYTDHCIINCYYRTRGGDDADVAICTQCMASPPNYKYWKNSLRNIGAEEMYLIRKLQGEISMRNIGAEGMYLVRKHRDWSPYTPDIDQCSICEDTMYTVFPRSVCPLCTH